MRLMRFGLLPLLSIAIFSLCACEPVAAPEGLDAVLQGEGDFAGERASFVIRSNDGIGTTVEVRAGETRRLLASGYLEADRVTDLLNEARGHLDSRISDGVLSASQKISALRPVSRIEGPAVHGAVSGVFRFEGERRMQYSLGTLQRGISGEVSLVFLKGDGSEIARLEKGKTTAENRRFPVGTDVRGETTGWSSWLMDASFGGVSSRLFADLALAPRGSGAFEFRGMRKSFSFDSYKDLTLSSDPSESAFTVVNQGKRYIEIMDKLSAGVRLRRVDLGDGLVGAGQGNLRYDLTVSVAPTGILVTGSSAIDAGLDTSDGRRFDFHGSAPSIQTELAW